MPENRPPDDELPWPLEEDPLDRTEMLELERTDEGYASWRSAEPPTWDTYRDWLPLRRRGVPTVEPQKAAPTDATAPDDQADRLRLELAAEAADPTEHAQEGRSARATDASLDPVFSGPIDCLPLPDRPVAAARVPLRLALVAPDAPRPVPPPHRRVPVWLERVGLFGAGAAAGLAAALLVDLAGPPTRPSAPAVLASAEHPDAATTSSAESGSAPASPLDDEPASEPSDPPAASAASAAPAASTDTVDSRTATTAARAAVGATMGDRAVEGPTPVTARPAFVPARTTSTRSSRRAATPAARTDSSRTPVAVPPEVLDTVRRYESAYTRMDVRATQAVWPTADRQQLVAAFTALREQRLTLARCVPTLAGTHATVTCRGTLRYRPRVGDHSTRTETGPWRFELERAGDGWVVTAVQAP